ncbi:MAG: hypothetical protein JSV04_14980 [Candidatus Heimdallarchaeota archaeon]|nr:MAG: hypothetical protein JSV04_14980 [Candidatus Heimdallarchaeota archaeon]
MTDILLQMSAIISMLLFAGLFLYAAVKFFRIWRKTREESLFHLGVMSLGMILYFFIIGIMIGFTDPDTAVFLIKRVIGIVYSILSLEMSLFYITAYINRRSLWEKYIPYIFGITTGTSLAIFGMNETDPWFPILLVIAYITPMILITILVIKITFWSYNLLKEDQLTPEDKGFIKVLVGTAIILFIGGIGDLSFFWLFVFIGPDIWPFMIILSGIISPLLFILSIFLIRTVFLSIEEVDFVHLMNLLS